MGNMQTRTGQPRRRPGPRYKLTEAQIEAVRIAHQKSTQTVKQIADNFGVSHQTIYNALARTKPDEQGEAA